MIHRQIVPTATLAIAFLGAAWLIHNERLWSSVGTSTVPWFCSAIALSLLMVGFTALLAQQPPDKIPLRVSGLVTVALTAGLAVGNAVDVHYYFAQESLAEAVIESLGFGAILTVSFWIPHLAKRSSQATSGA